MTIDNMQPTEPLKYSIVWYDGAGNLYKTDGLWRLRQNIFPEDSNDRKHSINLKTETTKLNVLIGWLHRCASKTFAQV